MPKFIITLPLLLCSSSCVVMYPAQWEAITVIDELTGEQTCRVRALSPMQTHSSFYPMVDMANGHIRVGMHSPDENPLPVGDIQLQIDNHYRFLIKQADMPYYLQQQIDITPRILAGHGPYLNHSKRAQRDQLQLSFSTATAKALASRSPYTVATGNNAKHLFDLMLMGDFLEYKILATELHASTSGRYPLNRDFLNSLQQCGISWHQ
ncbi:hypothetical protein [Photobacterium leiognathi]|uniref:hypothetical protein n=1 Tax=Photobacterium leiognathi TaxID=553611 RepID=UPI0027332189|nr:hypothetical protein [Photobacterium leiognathi]